MKICFIFKVHGRTNVAVLEKKSSSWLDLELVCENAQTLFTLAIMIYGADFNARVGATYNDEVINSDILGDKPLFDDKWK